MPIARSAAVLFGPIPLTERSEGEVIPEEAGDGEIEMGFTLDATSCEISLALSSNSLRTLGNPVTFFVDRTPPVAQHDARTP